MSALVSILFGAGLYFLLARAGLELATINQSASPFWPASGLALAFVWARGSRSWPAIFLGAFVANLGTGVPLAGVLGISAGNALEAVAAAWCLGALSRLRSHFVFHADTLALSLAIMLGSTLSAGIGSGSLVVSGTVPVSGFFSTLKTWWVGDVLGALLFAPLFMTFAERLADGSAWRRHLAQAISALPVLALVAALASMILFRFGGGGLLFLVFPLLFAVAAKRGVLTTRLSAALIGVLCILSTSWGYSAFRSGTFNQNLINLQLFLSSLAITALVLLEFKQKAALGKITFVVLAGWSLGGLLFHVAQRWESERSSSRFNALIVRSEQRVLSQMAIYENAFRGAASLFAALRGVSRADWQAYAETLQLESRYPGIFGLGVIFRVAPPRLADWLKHVRADGWPDFQVKSVPEGEVAPKDHYVITYIQPYQRNSDALGLDVATERKRREGAEKAWATRKFTITDTITLVQDRENGPGFLAFLPIFDHKNELLGWIYAPFTMRNFFQGAFDHDPTQLSVEVYANEKALEGGTPLYSAVTKPGSEKEHRKISTIDLGQRRFYLRWSHGPAYSFERETMLAWLGAVSVLLVLMTASSLMNLQVLNQRATKIADERTLQLRVLFRISEVFALARGDRDLIPRVLEVVLEELSWAGAVYWEWEGANLICAGAAERNDLADAGVAGFGVAVRARDRVMGVMEFFGHQIDRPSGELLKLLAEVGTRTGEFLDRLETEAALEAQKQRLVDASKMSALGEMSGGIAHEISNPLAIIHARAGLLKLAVESAKPPAHEEVVRTAEVILGTADRINRIVKGLRAFARKSDADPFVGVSVRSLVENTLVLCRERFKNHGVDLRMPAAPDVTLQCRESQISQVLLNLLNNAFDATEDQPEKWIKIDFGEGSSGEFIIAVADSGAGIAPEIADRIMQPFFTTKRSGKGTGLGLSISLNIVKEHGGSLVLDRSSMSTRFVMTLPLSQARHEGTS